MPSSDAWSWAAHRVLPVAPKGEQSGTAPMTCVRTLLRRAHLNAEHVGSEFLVRTIVAFFMEV